MHFIHEEEGLNSLKHMSVPTTSGFYSMGNLEEYNRKNIEKVIDYM